MDLIGEKIGEMIGDRGANDDDQNDEENLRFNPLRFAGKRGLWRSIYDNDKRGFNPKQIKDLIGEKRFNPSRFAGYGNRRIRSIWQYSQQGSEKLTLFARTYPNCPLSEQFGSVRLTLPDLSFYDFDLTSFF